MKNQNTKQVKLPNGTVYTRRCSGGSQHQKGRDRWTEGQVQTLIRFSITGMSNRDISEKMNRSYSSIVAKRQFMGITKKAVNELKKSSGGGLTPEAVSDIMIKPEKQPRWSNEEVSKLFKLVTAGLTNTEIGAAMGRSANSVREMRKRSNLPGSRAINASSSDHGSLSKESEDMQSLDSAPWRRIMSSFIGLK